VGYDNMALEGSYEPIEPLLGPRRYNVSTFEKLSFWKKFRNAKKLSHESEEKVVPTKNFRQDKIGKSFAHEGEQKNFRTKASKEGKPLVDCEEDRPIAP